MNKLILALTLSAAALAALPANAAPRNPGVAAQLPGAQSTIKVGDQCFRPTDSRGYGYWDSCENVYAFTVGRRALTIESRGDVGGTDGGGGDGGGGGGGGGGR